MNGDLFVQKAPAATIGTLAQAILELSGSSSKMQVIGTRHGEKKFETLVTREEMDKAIDLGKYYRVPADVRDLNYDKYFVEGKVQTEADEPYTSHNTAVTAAHSFRYPSISRIRSISIPSLLSP